VEIRGKNIEGSARNNNNDAVEDQAAGIADGLLRPYCDECKVNRRLMGQNIPGQAAMGA
jgi:hypothetical protein